MATQNNVFSISQPLIEFIAKKTGSVSSHIPSVATDLSGLIPIQTFDYAYSNQNDNSGSIPALLMRQPSLPEKIPYECVWNTFNTMLTQQQKAEIEQMTRQASFSTSFSNSGQNANLKNATGTAILDYVTRDLGIQYITKTEQDVIKAIKGATYTAGNTNSITTALPSWTDAQGGEFTGAIADGAQYLDKILGGMLLENAPDNNPTLSTDYELLIIIPYNIWTAFVSVWSKAFPTYVTLMGNVSPDARGLKADMFTSVCGFSGAKVIIASSFVNNSYTNILDTSSADFVNSWNDDCVYMVPVSKNIMRPAGLIKPTYMEQEMFSTPFLSNTYVETTTAYTYVSTAPNAFYKIQLATS